MITLLKKFFYVLLWDEAAAKRWLYGAWGFSLILVAQIFFQVGSVDALLALDGKGLLKLALTSAVGLVVGMLPAPKATPMPEASLPKGFSKVWLLPPVLAVAIGCSFLQGLGHSAASCLSKTSAQDLTVDKAEALIDDALHLDWAGAEAALVGYATQWGSDLVDCIVSDLRSQYGTLLGAPDAGPSVVSPRTARSVYENRSGGSIWAYENAGRWLARSK